MPKTRQEVDQALLAIAVKHLIGVTTLETRNSDALDFHDCAVWSIKAALEDAYRAGLRDGAAQA